MNVNSHRIEKGILRTLHTDEVELNQILKAQHETLPPETIAKMVNAAFQGLVFHYFCIEYGCRKYAFSLSTPRASITSEALEDMGHRHFLCSECKLYDD